MVIRITLFGSPSRDVFCVCSKQVSFEKSNWNNKIKIVDRNECKTNKIAIPNPEIKLSINSFCLFAKYSDQHSVSNTWLFELTCLDFSHSYRAKSVYSSYLTFVMSESCGIDSNSTCLVLNIIFSE